MDKQLERQLEEALEKAIHRREFSGQPFTVADLFNDLKALWESPEVQKAICIERITELLEDERARTGITPTEEDAKRLLQQESERLKLTEAERRKEWNQPIERRPLDETEIN